MRKFFATLRREKRGVAAVELALITPILAIMALGSIDFALGFSYKMQLQQYAQSGADFVIANGEFLPTDSEVQDEVVAISGLAASNVAVSKWTECNQAKQSTYGSCPGSGAVKASFMEITVTDTYSPILNLKGIADFASQTQLSGSVTVRLP